jgi:starch synthase (maltosyl-transferring)
VGELPSLTPKPRSTRARREASPALSLPSRVVIEGVAPEIDGGRFPIKRVIGDLVTVEANIFADGHDALSCRLLYRPEADADWTAVDLAPLGNDRWRGAFRVDAIGRYRYTIEGWVDPFRTWHRNMAARIAAGQDVAVDMLVGAALIDGAAGRATGADADRLRAWAHDLRTEDYAALRHAHALADDLAGLACRYPDRTLACRYERELAIVVDRKRARFSSWYELFPRSSAPEPGRHGTLRDVVAWLPDIAAMGFDVLYLPPIHPIGRAFRKGPNNTREAGPGDVGSPWAIGAREGGHMSVHPDLGTLEDFRVLVDEARARGLEVALDLAYQCAPDHPYVTEHPEWFRQRPDGTIQYAENPPKKYQDIYPFDFECDAWRELWEELRRVSLFWIDQGVSIFRVDNPHTKAFAFWEWMITDLKRLHPDVIFLAEAFTRPCPMYRLAKLGFSQSYTYFTWRNTKAELTAYFHELTQTEVREFFRPNLWPNTPDILHEYLQTGGRPAYMVRGVLAATLGANYGVYGPAFDLAEREPREPGSEEYRNSEKYEIRHRDLAAPGNLRPLLAALNRIRRQHPALQIDETLEFHDTDNPLLLCYSKMSPDADDVVVVVVNLDPVYPQSGWVTLDLGRLGLTGCETYEVHDELADSRYLWQGARNYVQLSPASGPAHIFAVRGHLQTEREAMSRADPPPEPVTARRPRAGAAVRKAGTRSK